jgi:hypothetical protein
MVEMNTGAKVCSQLGLFLQYAKYIWHWLKITRQYRVPIISASLVPLSMYMPISETASRKKSGRFQSNLGMHYETVKDKRVTMCCPEHQTYVLN